MSCAYNSEGGHSVLGADGGHNPLYSGCGCGMGVVCHITLYTTKSPAVTVPRSQGHLQQSGGHAHSHRQLLDGPRSVIPVTALSTMHVGVTAPCNCRQTSALNVPSVIDSIILKDKAPLGILLALEVGSICICRYVNQCT